MKTRVIIGPPLELDIKSVQVLDQPVQVIIKDRALFRLINPKIETTKNLIHNPGTRNMGIWHPNRSISSEDADQSMNSMIAVIKGVTYKGRPSTVEEIASYEVLFHKELKEIILVALGEKIREDSGEYVAYRSVDGPDRELGLDSWAGVWRSVYRFLVVFE